MLRLIALLGFLGSVPLLHGTEIPKPSPQACRYLKATHWLERLREHVALILGGMNVQDGMELSAAGLKVKEIDELPRTLPALITEEMVETRLGPIVDRSFSKEELETLIAFYSTPAGQKLVAKERAFLVEVSEPASKIMEELMGKLIERKQEERRKAREGKQQATGQEQKERP